MSEPQLAPTKLMLIWFCGTPRSRLSVACTCCCWENGSLPVCTDQLALLPEPTCCTIALLLAGELLTACCTWVMLLWPTGNLKTEPPLKSTVKFSPRVNRPTRQSTRISPEIMYQSRCRPTKSKETSPRYSRPPMLPRADITPPSAGWR